MTSQSKDNPLAGCLLYLVTKFHNFRRQINRSILKWWIKVPCYFLRWNFLWHLVGDVFFHIYHITFKVLKLHRHVFPTPTFTIPIFIVNSCCKNLISGVLLVIGKQAENECFKRRAYFTRNCSAISSDNITLVLTREVFTIQV